MRVIDAFILIIALTCLAVLWRTYASSDRDMYLNDQQLDDAHRILVELEITDNLLNILPTDLRNELHEYMEKCRGKKT